MRLSASTALIPKKLCCLFFLVNPTFAEWNY